MNRPDHLEHELREWFDETAAPLPAFTNDVLRLTAGMRQRSRWTVPERWLPMTIILRRPLLAPPMRLLAVGLALWIAVPASDAGALCLSGGLLGLLLMPLLRLASTLATAIRRRDWLLFMATLAVLAILGALTLRHSATH